MISFRALGEMLIVQLIQLPYFVIGIGTHPKIIVLNNQNLVTTEALGHTFNFERVQVKCLLTYYFETCLKKPRVCCGLNQGGLVSCIVNICPKILRFLTCWSSRKLTCVYMLVIPKGTGIMFMGLGNTL